MENNQLYSFLIFAVVGIILSILFDIFRSLRKSFKTSDLITYIEDICYWILAGFILIYSIFVFNNGEVRAYIFLGIGMGILLYLTFVSKMFIRVNVAIITTIKNIINKLVKSLLLPIKFIFNLIKKIFLKPISFIFINFRQSLKKIFKFSKKTSKKIIENKT